MAMPMGDGRVIGISTPLCDGCMAYDSDVDQPNRASGYDPYEHRAYEMHRGRTEHRGEDDAGGPSGYDPYCSECSASIFLNDRFYDSDDMGGPSG